MVDAYIGSRYLKLGVTSNLMHKKPETMGYKIKGVLNKTRFLGFCHLHSLTERSITYIEITSHLYLIGMYFRIVSIYTPRYLQSMSPIIYPTTVRTYNVGFIWSSYPRLRVPPLNNRQLLKCLKWWCFGCYLYEASIPSSRHQNQHPS